jgi:hypothetical protein
MTVRAASALALLAVLGALGAVPAASAAGVQISTSTTPRAARFGDVIQATISVRAPAAAQVQPGFSPYQVLRSRSASSRVGGVVTTISTFDLQCLDPQCAPGPGARRVALGPSRVLVGSKVMTARFARVVVDPRTTARQVAHPERSFLHPTIPARPTYRFSPTVLRIGLLGAAVLLVVLAAALLWPLLRPRRSRADQQQLDALARALALVRAARSRPPPDRRRALGLLSRILRRRGDAPVARAVADLAWSEPEPDSERMRQLADRVERSAT